MKSENITLINHIELILRELVEVAEKLNVLSTQAPLEEEINRLQLLEFDLLSKLQELDQELARSHLSHSFDAETQAHIKAMLERFEKLNQHFIDNLDSRGGLLKFEKKKLPADKK
ncbi:MULTISPECIES: hypothetical protein [Parachlamydia]|jgi:hypothetical protein|uniref:Uncharacterized protein n=2 Tax=Parachlamydia acanthamoebae TaxID=83552 RepID=F8KXM3_PARAV|nr:hypothetical protein [Parachlamydia acanthamoebae]EFB41249.1 hypothetical protein pah_c047o002 [Parachlamydia acanthamoebae str. Hall's coccus]KIA76898.1 hypothetical protein DB43_HD00240 [Parachlamydia acanthamoebae]CCB87402.1 putative uncharacterized protein [Parachlamydia acanthamoebae UV-7]